MANENMKKQFEARFPVRELSYERVLHNKVQSDLYVIIPRGKKQFLWFTYVDVRNVCLIVDYKRNYNGSITIKNISQYVCVFDESLSMGNGTIINGVLTTRQKTPFFTCEEILYYKGDIVIHRNQSFKLSKMMDLFKNNIRQEILTPKSLMICSPFIYNTYEKCIEKILSLDYQIFAIQFRRWKHKTPMGYYYVNENVLNGNETNEKVQQQSENKGKIKEKERTNQIQNKYENKYENKDKLKQEMNFIVMAGIQDDTYYMYTDALYENSKEHDKEENSEKEVLYIPDYKTSVMMNKIFRKIKENDNLDYLEESDDDDEFENISDDKYVDTNKKVIIKCVYYPKFKKWKPVEVVLNEKANIVNHHEYQEWKKKNMLRRKHHKVRNNQRYVNNRNRYRSKNKKFYT